MKAFIRKLTEINEALPVMLLADTAYLVIGEAIILLCLSDKARCAVGFLIGVLCAAAGAIQMCLALRKATQAGGNATRAYFLGTLVRIAVLILLLLLMVAFDFGNPVAALIGLLAIQAGPLLEPLVNKGKNKKNG